VRGRGVILAEIDRVLFENRRFATVEKFFGAGARIVRSTDPRR
jgi:hypothetical protein